MPPSPEVEGRDEGDVAARRTLVLLGLALVVVLLGAGLLVVAKHRHDDSGRRVAGPLPGAAAGGRPTDIGPTVNTELAPFVAARQQALASATGTRLAVVSLARYATEAEARHAVAPVPVVALVVAAPGGGPSVVRGSLADWAGRQRDQAKADFADVHTIVCSKSVDDPEFTSFYGTEEQRLLALESADGGSPVVFGVVVRAPVADLQSLAKAPGIRLVDVGRDGQFDAAAAYLGLRPEEVSVAGQPTVYRPFTGGRTPPPCPTTR
ncbi:MAG: hypothetical protein JWO37_2239 [Acidimicrobiales bacterium]|nr:hypothetical protein [Acidimicrobiales bacterium]